MRKKKKGAGGGISGNEGIFPRGHVSSFPVVLSSGSRIFRVNIALFNGYFAKIREREGERALFVVNVNDYFVAYTWQKSDRFEGYNVAASNHKNEQ